MLDFQNRREPIEFTAGDTLSFCRSFSDYSALNGWSLVYELRGGAQVIEFTSTANGSDHVILVTAAVTAKWQAGEYVLAGYAALPAIGQAPAERHQIYYGAMRLMQNLQGASGDVPVKTFKQQVLEAAEAAYLKAVTNNIVESDVEGTKIVREQRMRTYAAYATAYQDRKNEIAGERSKNCQPTGEKVKPRFNITGGGFSPYFSNNPFRTS